MNKLNIIKVGLLSATVAAVMVTTGCNKENKADVDDSAATDITLDTTEKKITYIVGHSMADQAKSTGVALDPAVMAKAIADVQAGVEPMIAKADQQKIMMAFQEEMQQKREAETKKVSEAAKTESEAFLKENATKEGVVTTESGLQYKVLSKGEEGAPSPSAEDTVKVHYHGTLIDGEVFDSSVDNGEPVSFPVNGVIKGWVEALQLMHVGDKFKLFIPSDLAYGERGTPGRIGPNSALIFEVELLEINPEIEGHEGHEGHGHE